MGWRQTLNALRSMPADLRSAQQALSSAAGSLQVLADVALAHHRTARSDAGACIVTLSGTFNLGSFDKPLIVTRYYSARLQLEPGVMATTELKHDCHLSEIRVWIEGPRDVAITGVRFGQCHVSTGPVREYTSHPHLTLSPTEPCLVTMERLP
jgi:hypothetical protein